MDLMDIPAPAAASRQVGAGHVALSPRQLIMFYSPDEWEEFTYEWLSGVAGNYKSVKKFAGAGDQGVDIAGFLSEDGFEGEWDCFQCKHYAGAVGWSDIFPELLKIFHHVAEADYVLPSKYVIVAPREVTTSLQQLLNTATQMRDKFLATLTEGYAGRANYQKIYDVAAAANFNIFRSAQMDEVLDDHRSTPHHSFRFGTALPARDEPELPPVDLQANESIYIRQLLAVYSERHSASYSAESAADDELTSTHFRKQRIRFFRAESLEKYARDSVPAGTYQAFKEDIYNGVIDVALDDHDSGYARLSKVLSAAGQINLASHLLATRAEQDDIKGVCHQLANRELLTWVQT